MYILYIYIYIYIYNAHYIALLASPKKIQKRQNPAKKYDKLLFYLWRLLYSYI